MLAPSFFFLFLLLFSTPAISSDTPIPRRALHLPFFPVATPPPAQPPSPSFPKYPSSSNSHPFFPFYTAPPPPSASSSPAVVSTLPANISSLIFPNSNSAPPRHPSAAKLVPAVALPLLALSLLALSLAFFIRRRRRHGPSHDDKTSRSDSMRLFPPGSAASDGPKPPPSDFLYLGTLVNSCANAVAIEPSPAATATVPQTNTTPYRKLGSPEIHPLPPLSRHARRGYGNADGACSSEEEFYSPKGSSGDKESSRQTFTAAAAAMEKCGSRSPTLSTPSYPSSNSASSPSPSSPAASSPPVGSSPARSSVRSLKSRSEKGEFIDLEIPRPPPPPPPQPLRPLTPSPPKRKPPSSSPPSSPLEKDQDTNFRISNISNPNLRSPQRIGDFSRNPFVVSSTQRQAPPPLRQGPPPPPLSRQTAPSPPPLPPPPPPPPPVGYWESRIRKPQASQPPVLAPPRPTGTKNSSAATFPAESPVNSEAVEKTEETPRPKLKPLHWDKVRASSDRAMVWDQLKSSSFQ